MRTYRHLWAKFISWDNFDLAAAKAVRGKKSKYSIDKFLAGRTDYLLRLQLVVSNGDFHTSQYRIIKIFEPKERYIFVLPLYPDHIVHHALINILGPIWQSMFIRDSYACIPGRGLHAASVRAMEFMRQYKYVLQCDIRKFFPSISHKRMMEIIARKITDKKILALLSEIVWSVGGDKNLPIGNLTSQWMGNVYLHELDMFVKHQLHWRAYIRYCDDFCLFGNDVTQLHYVAGLIKRFLASHLELSFSKCVVRPTHLGVDFIGYRHYDECVLLRRRTARRMRRRILNIARYGNMDNFARGQLASVHGWVKWANAHNYVKSIVRELETGPYDKNVVRFIRRHLQC